MVASQPRFQANQRSMKVARPTYARLSAIKQEMEAPDAKDRTVTFSEVLDELIRFWDGAAAIAREAREAGR